MEPIEMELEEEVGTVLTMDDELCKWRIPPLSHRQVLVA